MDDEFVLRVHEVRVQGLKPGRLAQRARGVPFVTHREERMRLGAHFAERGVVSHDPALVEMHHLGARLAPDDVRVDLQLPMCTTSSRCEPRRRCSHR